MTQPLVSIPLDEYEELINIRNDLKEELGTAKYIRIDGYKNQIFILKELPITYLQNEINRQDRLIDTLRADILKKENSECWLCKWLNPKCGCL